MKIISVLIGCVLSFITTVSQVRNPYTFEYVTEDSDYYYVGVDVTFETEDVFYECLSGGVACTIEATQSPDSFGRIPKMNAYKQGLGYYLRIIGK